MRGKIVLVLGIMVSFILISSGLVFGQNEAATDMPEPKTEPVTSVSNEPEIQWLWGEVVSVDTTSKTIILKYLDYETDAEKQGSVGVDENTLYENVKSLDEVKSKDTISVDYIVSSEGKNIAKNISVERAEALATEPEPAKDNPVPFLPEEETRPEQQP